MKPNQLVLWVEGGTRLAGPVGRGAGQRAERGGAGGGAPRRADHHQRGRVQRHGPHPGGDLGYRDRLGGCLG